MLNAALVAEGHPPLPSDALEALMSETGGCDMESPRAAAVGVALLAAVLAEHRASVINDANDAAAATTVQAEEEVGLALFTALFCSQNTVQLMTASTVDITNVTPLGRGVSATHKSSSGRTCN